jgi:hypothetical protein
MRAITTGKVFLAGLGAALMLCVLPASAGATTGTFSATPGGPNAVPGAGTSGPAAIYPWNVTVSGLPGVTDDVNVHLAGVSSTDIRDLDALLVAPNGVPSGSLFMSDVGDATPIAAPGIDLTFDDSAAGNAPIGSPLAAGSYRPTNGDGGDADLFAAPAPAGPYASNLAFANGFNPNGTWKLYLSDDTSATGTGSVTAASLTVSTNSNGQPPTSTNHHAGPKAKKGHGHHRRCRKHRRHRHHKRCHRHHHHHHHD